MKRPKLNFVIDAAAFVAFAFLTTTGVLTRYVLPPGSGRYATLWGLNRHGWGDLHFWVAVVLLGVLALHLALHWRWILCIVKGQRPEALGSRVAFGVVGLIGLLALAAAPLLAPVERSGAPRQGSGLPPSAIPAPIAAPAGTPAQADSTQGIPPPIGKDSSPVPAETPEPTTLGTESIRGSMTLRQVEQATGVPVGHLISRLGLPPGIDPDERIGRIRKRYDISPDDVRKVVKDYRSTR